MTEPIDRKALIERLLDPTISLAEAAVLLGVSKCTVRRYTNAGKLKCLSRGKRGHRKFKLLDVMELIDDDRFENDG